MIKLSQAQIEKRLSSMPIPTISQEELLDSVAWEMKNQSRVSALVALGLESSKELKKIAKRVKENIIFRKRFEEFSKIASPIWDKKREVYICMGLNK